ncbi:MAG: glycosyltransferase family 4 protein [Verrucomicrobiae bacterium]|nr:glycosyltransferase family 4 protein [Verrucomicrobiae bacterium]MCP5541628.1 glycosyltransferase family 4 protein [Akkermansiaceae bacterium]MCP5549276.1 glycosyltransferase family 4 protein [Akkermansiaceae bacterium]
MNQSLSKLTSRGFALVCHPWMGFGGSEATTMWTLQALQNAGHAGVAFVSASPVDFEKLNRVYGTSVSPEKIGVIRAPKLPGVNSGGRLAHLQSGWFQRYCRGLAPGYEVCVSAYNFVDFGRPGIQLVGDYTFSEALRRLLDPDAFRLARHRDHLPRRLYITAGDLLRGDADRPLPGRGDHVLANSDWTRGILSQNLGVACAGVLFPPVAFNPLADDKSNSARDPLGFVCLGRIAPEKRVEPMIRILDRVRDAGFPVNFHIAGSFETPEYGREIQKLAATRDWVSLPGFLAAGERDGLLKRVSFGLHARPAEAFGIAVAEMAGSGCIPFVPAVGGPAEIVENEDLRFNTEDEAVEKIVAVLSRPETHADLRARLAGSMDRFRPEVYMETFLREFDAFRATQQG